MKHIKTFEELSITDIKQYIVWYYKGYEVLKLYKFDKNSTDIIWTRDYLKYVNGEFKNIVDEHITNTINVSSSEELIFSSDDLDECKEFIMMHSSANKYNL